MKNSKITLVNILFVFGFLIIGAGIGYMAGLCHKPIKDCDNGGKTPGFTDLPLIDISTVNEMYNYYNANIKSDIITPGNNLVYFNVADIQNLCDKAKNNKPQLKYVYAVIGGFQPSGTFTKMYENTLGDLSGTTISDDMLKPHTAIILGIGNSLPGVTASSGNPPTPPSQTMASNVSINNGQIYLLYSSICPPPCLVCCDGKKDIDNDDKSKKGDKK